MSEKLNFCWGLCSPELVKELSRHVDHQHHDVIIKVLLQCQLENRNAFAEILRLLDNTRNYPGNLASLLSEVRKYYREKFRLYVAEFLADEGQTDFTYTNLLLRWLEEYQMCMRGGAT